ncbi:uncharacterized protein JCM15063_000207 [Sporobolomyces koalae]|uniref:uncharacterized protein n=1 Tax=Sporobolomyces koalae TaxID=500713 RepID=UPI003177D192
MYGLRTLKAARIGSASAKPVVSLARASRATVSASTRSYTTPSARRENDSRQSSSPSTTSQSGSRFASYRSQESSQHLYASSPETQKAYLENLLSAVSPLPNAQLIDTLLAERCLTHKSGVEKSYSRQRGGSANEALAAPEGGKNGHNEKMSFVGRRILRLYLTLHLNTKLSESRPALLAHAVSPRAIDALLNTKQLGATVGAAWKLEDAMRWREVRGPTGEMTGLWKVRGMGVEAVMGAVFTSQGIETASKLFHQLVLPNLTFPQTLRTALDESSAGASSTTEGLVQDQPSGTEATL